MKPAPASAAARLIAEDGITDYHLAKRKAARQQGAPEHTALPDNAEIDAELRAYQALYQADEQGEILQQMRETAIELLELFSDFTPYLTGYRSSKAPLDNTAPSTSFSLPIAPRWKSSCSTGTSLSTMSNPVTKRWMPSSP